MYCVISKRGATLIIYRRWVYLNRIDENLDLMRGDLDGVTFSSEDCILLQGGATASSVHSEDRRRLFPGLSNSDYRGYTRHRHCS